MLRFKKSQSLSSRTLLLISDSHKDFIPSSKQPSERLLVSFLCVVQEHYLSNTPQSVYGLVSSTFSPHGSLVVIDTWARSPNTMASAPAVSTNSSSCSGLVRPNTLKIVRPNTQNFRRPPLHPWSPNSLSWQGSLVSENTWLGFQPRVQTSHIYHAPSSRWKIYKLNLFCNGV